MFVSFLTKRSAHLFMLIICSLVLALMACGGGNTASSTPTSTPTSAPSPTSASNMKTYTGDGFTIAYPSDWKVDTSTAGQVVFVNASDTVAFLIKVVDNPSSGQTAADIVNAALQAYQSKPNFQPATDVPNSAMVGGDMWTQGGITYDATANGQTSNLKVVVLADGHPANSPNLKGFLIIYDAVTSMFDQANTNDFQPMLQSFMFTA